MEATLHGLGVQDPNHTAVPSFYVAGACEWFRDVMLILLVLSRVREEWMPVVDPV